MSKHTSGPWRIDGNNIRAAHGGLVATVEAGYQQMRDADARLIANAPDLLGALEDLTDDFAELGDPTYAEVYKRARAAIAKAKGE